MARPVRAEVSMADREMRRFVRYQQAEARRLGYPSMSTFARDIARGDIGVAPPTEEDKTLDSVGEFYHRLKQIEKRIVTEKYIQAGTEKERAKRAGVTVGRLRVMLDRILERCAGWLEARGS